MTRFAPHCTPRRACFGDGVRGEDTLESSLTKLSFFSTPITPPGARCGTPPPSSSPSPAANASSPVLLITCSKADPPCTRPRSSSPSACRRAMCPWPWLESLSLASPPDALRRVSEDCVWSPGGAKMLKTRRPNPPMPPPQAAAAARTSVSSRTIQGVGRLALRAPAAAMKAQVYSTGEEEAVLGGCENLRVSSTYPPGHGMQSSEAPGSGRSSAAEMGTDRRSIIPWASASVRPMRGSVHTKWPSSAVPPFSCSRCRSSTATNQPIGGRLCCAAAAL
mmetsp:Transcript_31587/g.102023  ORF Transcript_31587/g.102023 Transcript_31587/m.102023 type:complete len:278 (+) Transcript_31587:967-1800(+)